MQHTDLRDRLAHSIDYHLDTSAQTLERFAHELQLDAAHAFDWSSDSAIAAAAERAVWLEISSALLDKQDVPSIAGMAAVQALKEGASTTRSTSKGPNLVHQAKVIAWSSAAIELGKLCENA